MANYTVELREILGSRDIFKAIEYNLYNNEYKELFQKKFERRFYFREIGTETVSRFLINLETVLNEIMPTYEHLYKTTTYIYDPILNYDVQETIIKEVTGENSNSVNTSTSGSSNNYDAPVTSKTTYKNYPSFVVDGADATESTGTGNNKVNESNTRSTKGNIGVMTTQDLIIKERQIIINIDKMLLDELEILFMQVF